MKIAFFSDCYLDLTGGIRSSINAQKKALEDNGHEVYVFSTGYPKSKQELKNLKNQNIFQVPSCKFFFRGLTPISRKPKIVEKWLLKNYPEIKKFDIYYIHYESGCSIAGLKLAKKLNIPSVQVMHGREDEGESNIIPFGLRSIVAFFLNFFHSWYIPSQTKIKRDNYLANTYAKAKMWTLMVNHANYADLVLTPSEHFQKKLIHYGVKKDIKVFSSGFPDEKFPKNPPIKSLNPGEELKIIWHSRVSAEKRMMPFLRAVRKIQGKYRLDVYGGGGDFFRARRYAKRHKLNVFFHGNTTLDKLYGSIKKSHLDVLVSYNFDTFGMTLIEAESAGIPVLFCDPDMTEIVPKGSFIKSRNETPEAIADAINNLQKHPEKIEQMSKIMLKNRNGILMSSRIKDLEKIFNDIIKK